MNKVRLAEIVKLQDLVSYQEGAIVSREIINKESGSVTVFAFDRGQGLKEHNAPCDALVYVLDGEAEIVISGSSYRLQTSDFIIMPFISHTPSKPWKSLKCC